MIILFPLLLYFVPTIIIVSLILAKLSYIRSSKYRSFLLNVFSIICPLLLTVLYPTYFAFTTYVNAISGFDAINLVISGLIHLLIIVISMLIGHILFSLKWAFLAENANDVFEDDETSKKDKPLRKSAGTWLVFVFLITIPLALGAAVVSFPGIGIGLLSMGVTSLNYTVIDTLKKPSKKSITHTLPENPLPEEVLLDVEVNNAKEKKEIIVDPSIFAPENLNSKVSSSLTNIKNCLKGNEGYKKACANRQCGKAPCGGFYIGCGSCKYPYKCNQDEGVCSTAE